MPVPDQPATTPTATAAWLRRRLISSARRPRGWGYYEGKGQPNRAHLLGPHEPRQAGRRPQGPTSRATRAFSPSVSGATAGSLTPRVFPRINVAFNAMTAVAWLAFPELATAEMRRRLVEPPDVEQGCAGGGHGDVDPEQSIAGVVVVSDTFSWVEPTAWGVIALRKARARRDWYGRAFIRASPRASAFWSIASATEAGGTSAMPTCSSRLSGPTCRRRPWGSWPCASHSRTLPWLGASPFSTPPGTRNLVACCRVECHRPSRLRTQRGTPQCEAPRARRRDDRIRPVGRIGCGRAGTLQRGGASSGRNYSRRDVLKTLPLAALAARRRRPVRPERVPAARLLR